MLPTGSAVAMSRATLVVMPASIVGQWAAEITRWCPQLSVVVYPGTAELSAQRGGWQFCRHAQAWQSGNACARCNAAYRSGLKQYESRIAPDAVMADDDPRRQLGSGTKFRECTLWCAHTDAPATDWPCCTTQKSEFAHARVLAAMACADVVLTSYTVLAQDLVRQEASGRNNAMRSPLQVGW